MERHFFKYEKPEADSVEEDRGFEEFADPSLAIVIPGSLAETKEQNQEEYGKYIADKIVQAVEDAQKNNKKLVFDMATGSTPKSVWPELKKIVEEGSTSLSNLVVMGHEEAWGTYEPGSASDFDEYRKNVLLNLSQTVREITRIEQVSHDGIEGNFIPMHLEKVSRVDFPEGREGDILFRQSEKKAVASSVKRHQEIIEILKKRSDTVFLGLYGVGTDGHVGEMQVDSMGGEDSFRKRKAYADSIENYSIEHGLFYWKDEKGESGDFHPEGNVFWQRGAGEGDAIGRAVWQGYADIHEVSALGWKDMIEQDEMILAFNNEGKKLAFELAVEGSLNGKILDGNKNEVMSIEKNKGEGEKILADLKEYALELAEEGLIEKDSLEGNEFLNNSKKCGYIFKLIYDALDQQGAGHGNPIYVKMWEFANRYIGKRAPISRLIKMRTLFGKKTELVATPEVVKGTKYEKLSK